MTIHALTLTRPKMPQVDRRTHHKFKWLIAWLIWACGPDTLAAPYELRVYSDDIPRQGESELEWIVGVAHPRNSTDGPHGLVTQALVEYGFGLGKGWSIGLELPMSHTNEHTQANGVKAELQYVSDHNRQQGFYWGLRGDIGYTSSPYEAQGGNTTDINPIIGYRWPKWHLVVNPSVEIPLSNPHKRTEFQPSFKIARSMTGNRQLGVEYFSSWGRVSSLSPPQQRDETLYLVWDEKFTSSRLSFGIGQPLRPTMGSADKWVLKLGASMDMD